ncbi:hypothetical protein HDU93_007992 [Gonapodya sp. JEL0774]|nr:hypothetical protein HDU93_007992 [Gonapodya sp. JEL0774]
MSSVPVPDPSQLLVGDIIFYYIGGVSAPSAGQEGRSFGQFSRHFAVYCGSVCDVCRALCSTTEKCARPGCQGKVLEHQIVERVDRFPMGDALQPATTTHQVLTEGDERRHDVMEARAKRLVEIKKYKPCVNRVSWEEFGERASPGKIYRRCYSEKELADFRKRQVFWLHPKFKEKYGHGHEETALWTGHGTAKRALLEEGTPEWMNEYHVVFNNCQHFTNWCKFGLFMSDDVHFTLKMLKPITYIPFGGIVGGAVVAAVLSSIVPGLRRDLYKSVCVLASTAIRGNQSRKDLESESLTAYRILNIPASYLLKIMAQPGGDTLLKSLSEDDVQVYMDV